MTIDKKTLADFLKIKDYSLIDRLSDEQIDFILHDINKPCFLEACAGSGKTEVVGIKAAFEIKKWNKAHNGIAVLSFTKNSAKEIYDRIVKYSGYEAIKYPHYVGTIDSWLHGYILQPFAHLISGFQGRGEDKSIILVDDNKQAWLSNFTTRINNNVIEINDFSKNIQGSLVSYSNFLTENLLQDHKIKHSLLEKKDQFFKAGLATYSDAEYLIYKILQGNSSIRDAIATKFPVIIVDECQDLSYTQLVNLYYLKEANVVIHIIGDINQSIYKFRNVLPEKVIKFIKKVGFDKKPLTLNYRSNQQIVDISTHLEANCQEKVLPCKKIGKEPTLYPNNCFVYEYNGKEELPLLHEGFNGYIKERNIDISRTAILVRGKSLAKELYPFDIDELDKMEMIINAIYLWNIYNKDITTINRSLNLLGNALKILIYNGKGKLKSYGCPLHIKETQWRLMLVKFLEQVLSPNLFPFNEIKLQKWVGMLKNQILESWEFLIEPQTNFEKIKNKFKCPNGKILKNVKDVIISDYNDNLIRVSTIHEVKGETLEAVMLVSSYENKGAKTGRYYTDWIKSSPKDDNEREYVRFAYVASSRPKHLLIWAIPKGVSSVNKKRLSEMGFKWIDSFDKLVS